MGNRSYLCARDYTLGLNTQNCLRHKGSREIRVGRKAFPVTASPYHTTQWSDDRAEVDVDTLDSELETHGFCAVSSKVLVPASGNMEATRESTDEISAADTLTSIVEAETGEVHARDSVNIAGTAVNCSRATS